MPKLVNRLDLDIVHDYYLIGISSHEHDYRIAWLINNVLSLNLVKVDDLIIFQRKSAIEQQFSLYSWYDDDELLQYHLIGNSSETGFLVRELSNIDYFFKISGELTAGFIEKKIDQLKKCEQIHLAISIEPQQIKNPTVFIF